MSLENKKVVIIGGSSGIGLATAKAAVSEGASVVIESRSEEKLNSARTEIGSNCEVLPLDFTREDSVKNFFDQSGEIDHLVTTAMTGAMGPFLELDTATARAVFDSKFWGQYYAARYGAPKIKAGGSITLFSGAASQKPVPGLVAIAAVNGAVEGLCRTLAAELSPIRVNAVSPGLVATPLYDKMPDEKRSAFFGFMADKLPVKRVGTAEDLAQTVLYLINNGFTTGAVIDVNGGAIIV